MIETTRSFLRVKQKDLIDRSNEGWVIASGPFESCSVGLWWWMEMAPTGTGIG